MAIEYGKTINQINKQKNSKIQISEVLPRDEIHCSFDFLKAG